MHIAFFTNTYHPYVSGVVRSVSLFRKALTELGNNVFVFAQNADNYVDEEPFIFRYPALTTSWPTDMFAVIPISPSVDYLLPSLRLDVIHSHHPVLLGSTAATKAAELNVPLVFTFHSQYTEYSQYIPWNKETIQEFLKTLIEKWLGDYMQKCHHIIVPTYSMLEQLKEHFDIRDKFSVIPTGIDVRRFQNADEKEIRERHGWQDDIILISVGRLTPEKNWKRLIEACAKARRIHPRLRLALIGDGFDRENLEKFVQKVGMGDRTDFLGALPYEQIPAYLKAADLFGFASTAETQGLVTMEAIAAGLPVVAVDGVGTRDVVKSNVTGLLTKNDSNSLSNAISTVLSQQDLMNKFRHNAAKQAQEFDIRWQAEKLMAVYQQAREDFNAGETVILHKRKKLLSSLRGWQT
jgi:glycosyltransferase involved in cell wall biosynthesis